ncbi:WGR domain-containing protein [Sphingobium sp. B11D3A]|uniref:WGR domain-containing protein n=1 Tax=Sphingobium sp. B11D3A TaxID=2940574 RepID=UPI0022244F93|nr:WGR domain-containing protein [Sphingobium sp. B11D3A]MCW2393517.1 putative DNA-binding WGR domain protein [Sphingobium sp. B11D3A]
MLTDDNQHIRLQAVDQARNIARRYEIHAQRDLFGALVVDYSWGRIGGGAGQTRRVSFEDADRGARFVRQLLKRRASAKARLGVEYRRV